MRTMTMDRASNSLLISIVEDYCNFLLSFFETWIVVDGAVYTLHTLLNDHDIDSKWDFLSILWIGGFCVQTLLLALQKREISLLRPGVTRICMPLRLRKRCLSKQ